MRAIGLDDGKNLAKFFNISFPLWVRQSHIINTPRYSLRLVCFPYSSYQTFQSFQSPLFHDWTFLQ